MALYPLARAALFCLPPELAHTFTLKSLKVLYHTGALSFCSKIHKPVKAMGLTFQNPVGLAAGLDKNGAYIDPLGALGFGFVEIGTVTPLPQVGNPKPRLFRLKSEKALINRMGFNNHGVDSLIQSVKKRRYKGILGINIGKNKATPLEYASKDYLSAMGKVYNYADYITINISSPNTPGLTSLQAAATLAPLLQALKQEQQLLADKYERYVPLVVKVSPDGPDEGIAALADTILSSKIDGIIATNTTITRPLPKGILHGQEAGGLSGDPLFDRATYCLSSLAAHVKGEIPIIASGGVGSAQQAQAKLSAGATLVQLYTGLIYQGPGLVQNVGNAI
jgi:dihydroorotate dehydrogenase